MTGARTEADRQLARLFRLGTLGGLTDAQLLEQFVAGDEDRAAAAFEAIVGRHGPMVLRVCRIVLRDAHAADDAFQATFLVLARKARTIGERALLSNWLYGVATRTARKAKVIAARQIDRDRAAARGRCVLIDDRPPDDDPDELCCILHEEIGRLPGSYRAAVVVCYLEGMTQEQAARRLRVAESTVRGRLARARKLLGHRLTRRGVSLATTLVALGRVGDVAVVAAATRLPDATVQSLARSALLFGKSGKATSGAVSATAQGIANGVLSNMWLPSLKTVAAVLIACTLATAVALTHRAAEAQPQREASQPKGANATSAPTATERSAAQSLSINSELVQIVPAPIVRAIPVTKDCMILSYLPDWAHGNVDNIAVANNHGGVRTLIDWSEIPSDLASAPDRRFLIALYSRDTQSHPPAGPIHAFAINQNWPEITSWKTQPGYDPDPAATYQLEPGTGWKLFDVTPIVRDEAKGGKKGHGVLIRFLSEDFSERGTAPSSYNFVSREGTGQWAIRHPVLLVVEASNADLPRRPASERSRTEPPAAEVTRPPMAASEDLPSKNSQADSPDTELVKLVPGPIVRSTVVSKDCMVLSYMPGWNFGQVDNIGIGNNGGGVRTLIDWPEVPPDEAGSLDRQFLIAVYSRHTISHPPAGPIHAFEILDDWPEMTSWTTQPRYGSEPAATYEFKPEEGWKLFDITPLVRSQARAGRKHYGAVFRFWSEDFSAAPRETFSDYKMVSREGSGQWVNRRPMLLVVKAAKPEKTLAR
jgi:RNA polymerase sigma factor (sigma-70 family)